MNWRPNSLRGRRLLPSSIVARTTLSIIVFALVVGAGFTGFAAWLVQRNEEAQLRERLGELLSTVESTARIACFVNDTALAREIGLGLMSNHAVAGLRIRTTDTLLYEQFRGERQRQQPITRALYSPFNAGDRVGSIELWPSEAEIVAQAWGYTRFIMLVLGLEVLLVALGVARVVFKLITRPIKGISDELHRLEVRSGVRLQVPDGNQQDEIGRLVSDVNGLIAKLTSLLETERGLRLEREASERRLSQIIEKVDAGIFEIDGGGTLHSWNPAFVRTIGQPPEPPRLAELMPGHGGELKQLLQDSLAHGDLRERDFELAAPAGGTTRWVELSLTPVENWLLQGVINDITPRKQAEQAAQELAARDSLTGLLNRRGLDLGLTAAFGQRQRDPGMLIAVMQIDLDYFKEVNDQLGHEAGDQVLRSVAASIEHTVRRSDLVARPGGDEFTVVLPGIDGLDKAEALGKQLVAKLSQPITLDGGELAQIGASIGITLVAADEDNATAALARADQAMYAAKQAGRCRVCVVAPPAA
ncbi:MAG: diguanylate cyclase [Stagnimonas sp.]|nr:diguanylate cyclase [Stagnimonas sp.]